MQATWTVDNASPLFSYSGSWTDVRDKPPAYHDTLRTTSTYGDQATIKFTGTSINILFTQGSAYGKVSVTVDGGEAKIIDLHDASGDFVVPNNAQFDAPGLSQGEHTVVIQKADNDATTIGLDFAIIGSTLTGTTVSQNFDNEDTHADLSDGWEQMRLGPKYYASTLYAAHGPNMHISFDFVGQALDIIGATATDGGKFQVLIDDKDQGTFDGHASGTSLNNTIFAVGGLSEGPHYATIINIDRAVNFDWLTVWGEKPAVGAAGSLGSIYQAAAPQSSSTPAVAPVQQAETTAPVASQVEAAPTTQEAPPVVEPTVQETTSTPVQVPVQTIKQSLEAVISQIADPTTEAKTTEPAQTIQATANLQVDTSTPTSDAKSEDLETVAETDKDGAVTVSTKNVFSTTNLGSQNTTDTESISSLLTAPASRATKTSKEQMTTITRTTALATTLKGAVLTLSNGVMTTQSSVTTTVASTETTVEVKSEEASSADAPVTDKNEPGNGAAGNTDSVITIQPTTTTYETVINGQTTKVTTTIAAGQVLNSAGDTPHSVKESSMNVGLVAGVVVGVLALLGLVGLYLIMRKRRAMKNDRKKISEQYWAGGVSNEDVYAGSPSSRNSPDLHPQQPTYRYSAASSSVWPDAGVGAGAAAATYPESISSTMYNAKQHGHVPRPIEVQSPMSASGHLLPETPRSAASDQGRGSLLRGLLSRPTASVPHDPNRPLYDEGHAARGRANARSMAQTASVYSANTEFTEYPQSVHNGPGNYNYSVYDPHVPAMPNLPPQFHTEYVTSPTSMNHGNHQQEVMR